MPANQNPMETKHYGFFRGIVMQNNDPERRGRVKISIPEFSAQFSKEYGLKDDVYESRFVGGDNINTLYSKEILQKFCDVLIWAEQASPLIGGGTSGVFDAKNGVATVGEGYRGTLREPLDEESITPSGESVSPKAALSINAVPGGFDVGSKTGTCDVANNSIAPSPINNAAKGMFSVPRVGSQVWVFFENGSLDHPVYMGYVMDKSDWNSVTNPQGSNPSLHYPSGSENMQDKEAYLFTGQTVLNTKAGSIEFIETDDLEKIKISHYSGSLYEMTNHHTNEVCVENKTTIVNENEHHTVRGEYSLIVEGETKLTYRNDYHLTYGDPENKSFYDEWVDTAKPAFSHAAQFGKQDRSIPDPTKTGESKGGPNDNFTHPSENRTRDLTLRTSWTSLIRGMNPTSYSSKVQHTELGVH